MIVVFHYIIEKLNFEEKKIYLNTFHEKPAISLYISF